MKPFFSFIQTTVMGLAILAFFAIGIPGVYAQSGSPPSEITPTAHLAMLTAASRSAVPQW